MYLVYWNFKEYEKTKPGFPCPGYESLTLPIAQSNLAKLQQQYPGLVHWIIDTDTGEKV